jgi:hypothetical protein
MVRLVLIPILVFPLFYDIIPYLPCSHFGLLIVRTASRSLSYCSLFIDSLRALPYDKLAQPRLLLYI